MLQAHTHTYIPYIKGKDEIIGEGCCSGDEEESTPKVHTYRNLYDQKLTCIVVLAIPVIHTHSERERERGIEKEKKSCSSCQRYKYIIPLRW